jgi:hypothetical protein
MKTLRPLLWLLLWGGSSAGFAHHAFTEYDQTRVAEIAGKLVEIRWQNPHVRLKMQASDGPAVWDIEGHSVSILRRTNASPEILKPGTQVRLAGWLSRRTPNRLFVTNLLVEGQQEMVVQPGLQPRWQKVAKGTDTTWFQGGTTGDAKLGLFRVWSTKFDDPETSPAALWRTKFPLTERGQRAVAAWNPEKDTITRGCEPKGMPTIMEQPYPIEFVQKSDRILLRLEELRHRAHDLPVEGAGLHEASADGERPFDREMGRQDARRRDDAHLLALRRRPGRSAKRRGETHRALHPECRRYAPAVFRRGPRRGDLHRPRGNEARLGVAAGRAGEALPVRGLTHRSRAKPDHPSRRSSSLRTVGHSWLRGSITAKWPASRRRTSFTC